MTLKEIFTDSFQYTSSWSIYIDDTVALTPNTEVRVGQNQFNQGGILDGKVELMTLELATDIITEYFGDIPDEDVSGFITQFIYDEILPFWEEKQ